MDVRVGQWRKLSSKKIDAFGLWCWRRLLRVPWTTRRSNQSILKEISPGCSLEGLMLKVKLQYFGHLRWRVDSLERPWCWEGLGAGGEGDDRRWDGWMASLTLWGWVWVDSGSWWWTGRPGVLRFMGSQWVGHDWATELNWTEPSNLHFSWSISFYYSLLVAHINKLESFNNLESSLMFCFCQISDIQLLNTPSISIIRLVTVGFVRVFCLFVCFLFI